jgi:polyisoprenoid-binding protein YceI
MRFAKWALGTMLAAMAAAAAVGEAQAENEGALYHFGLFEKQTTVLFTSEADAENIYGKGHRADGRTWLDFEGGKGRCNITVPVKSLTTDIELRDEHMRSAKWLDEKKYPDITLVSDGFDVAVKNKDKGIYEAKFKGRLTIHGVTKDLETTAKIVKVSKEMGEKIGQGDWVRVTASFDVKLKDFDIKVDDDIAAKVSGTWAVKFDCYASTWDGQTAK